MTEFPELSDRERIAFERLRKGPASLDEICSTMRDNGIIIRQNHSVIITMKYLSAKISPHGWIISNSGGIGRGRHAKYSMEKKF